MPRLLVCGGERELTDLDADDFEDIFRADTPDESRAPTNEEETTEAA